MTAKKTIPDTTTPTKYVVDFGKLTDDQDISLNKMFKGKSLKPSEVIDRLWKAFGEKDLLQAK